MREVVVVAAFCAVAIAVTARAAPVPKHLIKARDALFPTTVGTKWIYYDDPQEWMEVVSKVEDKGERVIVHIDRTMLKCGKGTSTWSVALDAEGVHRVSVGDMKECQPLALLKLPLHKGETWNFTWREGCTETFELLGSEEVIVPAGKYQAMVVECTPPKELRLNGLTFGKTSKYWFAPGVGVVKRTWGKVEMLLKSFTPGKE